MKEIASFFGLSLLVALGKSLLALLEAIFAVQDHFVLDTAIHEAEELAVHLELHLQNDALPLLRP